MSDYYPQGAVVLLDHDPYGERDHRPALIVSDDKHPDRYEGLDDPGYSALLTTTGFYTDNAWALKIGVRDVDDMKFARRGSHVELWSGLTIYDSEIEQYIADVTDDFLRTVGEGLAAWLDPGERRF
jgi:hypothetical protein